jgi:hypothetical protein
MLVLGKNFLHGATVLSGEGDALSRRRRLAAGDRGQVLVRETPGPL